MKFQPSPLPERILCQNAEAVVDNALEHWGDGRHETPQAVRDELTKMGYTLTFEERTSGPINAIFLDREHGTMWGGSSNHGDDYGIAW